jgi:hypothetical protein
MKRITNRLGEPFWIVTSVSGWLALLALVALLVIYALAGQWQYLGLGGLVAVTCRACG